MDFNLLTNILGETIEAIKDNDFPEEIKSELKQILRDVKSDCERTILLYE